MVDRAIFWATALACSSWAVPAAGRASHDGPSPEAPRHGTTREEYQRCALAHRGDAGRGWVLFADPKRLACSRCHRVRGEGGEISPDLSDIGGKYDRPLLIESVLEPSRQIVEGYRDTRFRGPIHAYPVASIAGGAFCPTGPPAHFPPQFRGKYFFADFVKGWIKVLDPDRPEEVATFATGFARPVDLRFALDGSLDVLLRDAWVKDRNFRPGTGSLHHSRFVAQPEAGDR